MLTCDGQYSKNEVAEGLRSGDSFVVLGDLINYFDFQAVSPSGIASMGGDLELKARGHGWRNQPLEIIIKFKSPATNNNGDVPVVNHIDLIAVAIQGLIDTPKALITPKPPTKTPRLSRPSRKKTGRWIETAIMSLNTGSKILTAACISDSGVPTWLKNTPHETDKNGNPLSDFEATDYLGLDGAAKAWADLWFYSNPIFVFTE